MKILVAICLTNNLSILHVWVLPLDVNNKIVGSKYRHKFASDADVWSHGLTQTWLVDFALALAMNAFICRWIQQSI